jgi:uncharacterized protein DUF5753
MVMSTTTCPTASSSSVHLLWGRRATRAELIDALTAGAPFTVNATTLPPCPVTLDVLCLEVALRAAVGGTEVMRDQLNRLVQGSQRNNITLRVVPFSAGAPAVFGTSFAIYDFPGADGGAWCSTRSRVIMRSLMT